jgi:hypothetical protein
MLRHLIANPDTFDLLPTYAPQRDVLTEFFHQFSAEFEYNAAIRANEIDNFDFNREWGYVATRLVSMESMYPILLRWTRH